MCVRIYIPAGSELLVRVRRQFLGPKIAGREISDLLFFMSIVEYFNQLCDI